MYVFYYALLILSSTTASSPYRYIEQTLDIHAMVTCYVNLILKKIYYTFHVFYMFLFSFFSSFSVPIDANLDMHFSVRFKC